MAANVGRGTGTARAGVTMILIGLGANLPSPRHGRPRQTLEAALGALVEDGIGVVRRSRWYESPPMPPSAQPMYVNGVAVVRTGLNPVALLAALHEIEVRLGRVRRSRNEARPIDLDILGYHRVVRRRGAAPRLPHPRLHERPFVLLPLREVAPRWRHPIDGRTVAAMIAALPVSSIAEPIEETRA